MAGTDSGRCIHVAAGDDTLVRALREQRWLAAAWRVVTLDAAEPPQADALVIVDLGDDDARRQATDAVRGGGFAGPILVMGGAVDESVAYEIVPRPVRLGAMLSRIAAHKAANIAGDTPMLGPYELVAADYALRDVESGRLVRLTELELRLLTFLVESGGGLVDREQLLRQVWGYSAEADTHTVETHIWRLRQKIETDDPATRFVVTETGGYRLVLAGQGQAS